MQLIKKIKNIANNSFVKNVSTLAIGSVLSQVITVLGSFALARIYIAESFGLLSLFASLSSIFAVIATGRYEYAILLPEKDNDAKKIVHLIWAIAFCISFVFLLIILVLRHIQIGKFTEIVHSTIFLIFPLHVFFIAVFSSLQYWIQRRKDYKKISILALIQSIVNVFVSVGLGLIFVKFGLIIGAVSAIVITSGYILFIYKELFQFSNLNELLLIANKYISFPKFMLVSDVSISFSQQFVPILFTSLFSTSVVGLYYIANRLLRLPTIVLTSSISDVFRNEAIDRLREHGNCTSLYFQTLKKLVSIALPTFILIYFLSPFGFALVLGEEWKTSGFYAQILCIVLFFEFISLPMNSLFYIFEKQKIYMFIQVLNSITGFLFIILIFKLYNNVSFCILAYSINASIYNLILLYNTYKLSQKRILL